MHSSLSHRCRVGEPAAVENLGLPVFSNRKGLTAGSSMVLALQLSQKSQQVAFHRQREVEKRYEARMRSTPLPCSVKVFPCPRKTGGKNSPARVCGYG